MAASTLIIITKWVCLCFFVSVLLISTLAVSSASARKLVLSETLQKTIHNPNRNSFHSNHEQNGRTGREEGPYESDIFQISTKVPRSAHYGNMDRILSNPAVPENEDHVVPKSADNVDIDEVPSVSVAESENADLVVQKNADNVDIDEVPSVSVAESENADLVVQKNADNVDIDEVPSVSMAESENADHVVSKNSDLDDIDEVPSVSENVDFVNIGEVPSVSAAESENTDNVVPENADFVDIDEVPSVSAAAESENADHGVPKNADNVNMDDFLSVSEHKNADHVPDHEEQFESSIYELDHEEQIESKDSANALKPAGSSDSANAEAAKGVPIH